GSGGGGDSMSVRVTSVAAVSVVGLAIFAAASACGDDRDRFANGPGALANVPDAGDAGGCLFQGSLARRSGLSSCPGEAGETCAADLACGAGKCQEPCAAAGAEQSSNGCEFFFQSPVTYSDSPDNCYATFIVNTSAQPTEVTLERDGKALDLSSAVF